jgi:hypothetical protein
LKFQYAPSLGYNAAMPETTTRPLPSARPPTEAELAAWQALSRDEQLARTREALLAPDAARVSTASMTDVLTAARQHVAARRDRFRPGADIQRVG